MGKLLGQLIDLWHRLVAIASVYPHWVAGIVGLTILAVGFGLLYSPSELSSMPPKGSATWFEPRQDNDGDGLPDGFELAHGLAPLDEDDADADVDSDGLSHATELEFGTHPLIVATAQSEIRNVHRPSSGEWLSSFASSSWRRASIA